LNNESLKIQLGSLFPSATFQEGTEWLTLQADASQWKLLAHQLFNGEALQFDFLFCITAIDWKTHFTLVYHLRSTQLKHILVVKINLAHDIPEIESVSHIWRTAEFHEREAFDLMGIIFLHHPDLRRLFMPDEYEEFPLRKDFEDPVNMIKL